MSKNLSIYIHIPFCKSRCDYCDFVSSAGRESSLPEYLSALEKEIESVVSRNSIHEQVHSIYLGGGTPSLLSAAQIAQVLTMITSRLNCTADAEITLEANPGDCSVDFAHGITACGVNRVSLGMQSSDADELRRMGRRHTFHQTVESVRLLRAAGIRNLSLDLIFGYPLQTMQSWENSLNDALSLEPDHLSLYALGVEPGTALHQSIQNGELPKPDDDFAADQYHFARSLLNAHGFRHYEISNWSRDPIFDSRHNCQYWKMDPYLGLGVGAHGYYNHLRTQNTDDLNQYIRQINHMKNNPSFSFPAASEVTPQDIKTEQNDFMIFGLRMLQNGVNARDFTARFGSSFEQVYSRQLRKMIAQGWVRLDEQGNLLLHDEFAFMSNHIMVEFI